MSPNSLSSSRMKLRAGFVLGSLLVILSMLLAACGGSTTQNPQQPTHRVLKIGGFVGPSMTKVTSLYNGNVLPGVQGLVYETLFFNNLSDGKYTPLLGLSYSWNSDNTVLTVPLRQNVKWNDGQAFSADDVAFTFNTVLTEAKGVADTNGLWGYLKSVTATDPNTIAFTFKSAHTPLGYLILSQTYIVPQHVWKDVSAPTTANPDLIGTGPFKLSKFTPSLFVLQRNSDYWNNASNKIDEIQYPAIKDNATLEEELIAGKLDWGSFGADASLQSAYVDKDKEHNKYWFSSTAIVGLYLNDSKPPFNDPNLRQAISAALDRGAMSSQAENGYESPANSVGVATNNAAFLQSQYSTVASTPAPDKVAQFMTAGGYTKSNGFYVDKSGNKIVVKYNVPQDFSDWVAVAQIMKQNLQAVGIDGEINAITDDNYFSTRSTGSFDAMIGGLFAGPTPFYLYDKHLNSANDASTGGFNWGHYHSAKMDGLLQQYAATSDTATQTTLINQMEDLFNTDMPIIPLLNAANWYEYSTKHYTGWPSQDNPYALGPDYDAPGNEIIVTHLQPAS